jgi:uncharacterized LabA/DUF88 family protein
MSIIKHPAQRVAVFIDAQNLYHSAKHLYGSKVNFGKLVEDAVAGRPLVRAIAYVISTEEGTEQTFFEALGKVGIEAKTKDLQIFAGGAKKGDWDVGLAIDAVKLAPKLDVVIIVSGDGDYVPLVEYLQINEGCQVEAVSFGRSSSARLIEAVDDFYDLDEDPAKYLLGYRGGNRSTSPANRQSTERTPSTHRQSGVRRVERKVE